VVVDACALFAAFFKDTPRHDQVYDFIMQAVGEGVLLLSAPMLQHELFCTFKKWTRTAKKREELCTKLGHWNLEPKWNEIIDFVHQNVTFLLNFDQAIAEAKVLCMKCEEHGGYYGTMDSLYAACVSCIDDPTQGFIVSFDRRLRENTVSCTGCRSYP
jgi:predicted nucleic acid-binding protein